MTRVLSRVGMCAVFLAAAFGFALLNRHQAGNTHTEGELATALPVPLQIMFSGGDRYLASNVGTWRALMVGTGKLRKDVLHSLATVQLDASWLNPAHEDNYYLAAAILPWEGEYVAAQTILERAADVRPNDFLPGFFYAFNKLQFQGDALGAAAALISASEQAVDPGDAQALKVMAARWSEKHADISAAITMQESVAENTKDIPLRRYLTQRVVLMRGLQMLRDAQRRCDSLGIAVNSPRDLAQCTSEPLHWEEGRWDNYGFVSGRVVIVAR